MAFKFLKWGTIQPCLGIKCLSTLQHTQITYDWVETWDKLQQLLDFLGYSGMGCLEEKFWSNLVENCSSSLWRNSHHPLSFNNYRLNSNYMLLMPLMLNWFLSNHHPPMLIIYKLRQQHSSQRGQLSANYQSPWRTFGYFISDLSYILFVNILVFWDHTPKYW